MIHWVSIRCDRYTFNYHFELDAHVFEDTVEVERTGGIEHVRGINNTIDCYIVNTLQVGALATTDVLTITKQHNDKGDKTKASVQSIH